MQPKVVLSFDSFDGGEFGLEAPWRAQKDTFTGTNVQRYVDGSIGPRNGLKSLPLTGASMTGVVNGWGTIGLAALKFMWLIVDANVYLMDGAGAVTSAGTVASAPVEPPQSVNYEGKSYVSSLGDKLYEIDHVAGTTTALTASNTPGCRCIVQYGERVIAGGGDIVGPGVAKGPDGLACPANRLFFSDPSDPTSWPAENFIDVADPSLGIRALSPQRTHLTIVMSDGSWWILTGVPGVNPVLRKALSSIAPYYPTHCTEIGNGNIGYVIGSSPIGSTASLGEFTGSQLSFADKLFFGDGRLTAPLPTYTVSPLKNIDDWFVIGGPSVAPGKLALNQFGAWSLHQFGVTLAGFCVSDHISADRHFFTDGGSSGVTPKFYEWRSYANRVPFAADTFMRPGDDSTTPLAATFTLPEWMPVISAATAPSSSGLGRIQADGTEVSVQAVVVDFTAWNTGSSTPNSLKVTPLVHRTYEGGSITGTPATWSEPGSAASSGLAGSRRRHRFDFSGIPAGGSFSLQFDLAGVAIQKILVHVETRGERM